jgi:hypothetical protein
MRLRWVVALVAVGGLLVGLTMGYTAWHGDGSAGTSSEVIVTNRTDESLGSGAVRFCLNFRVANESQGQCWTQTGGAPSCWANSKIGEALPDECR